MHRTFFFTDAEPLKTEILKFENSSENFTHWKIALKTGRFSYRTKRPSVVTRIPSLQEGRNALPISNSDLECCVTLRCWPASATAAAAAPVGT